MFEVHAIWKQKTGQMKVQSAEVKSLNFIALLEPKNGKAVEDGKTYTVDCCCDANGDIVWSKTCDGKFSFNS
jgi:hypothetical protein